MGRAAKVLCLILTAAAVAAALLGCGKNGPAVQTDQLAGFETTEQISGGAGMSETNLRSVSVSQNGQDTVMSFGFLSGSRISGSASEEEVSHVPPYTVGMLSSPYRLVVRIDGLKYWDFLRDMELGGQPAFSGCFQYAVQDADAVAVCFQLTGAYGFAVAEEGASLNITLRSAAPAQEAQPEETHDGVEDVTGGKKYYVVANAYLDFCNGTLTQQLDMAPALCKNQSDILLISAPFETDAQANALLSELLKLENVVPTAWRVVQLEENELPEYNEEWAYYAANTTEVMRQDGVAAAAPLLIRDGLLLCMTPERDGYLYSKRVTGGSLEAGAYSYEQIYLMSKRDGSARPLLEFEFETLERASYSPDGRKLAVLARTAENTHLYIFDMDNKELLTDLANMGFGDMVSTFTWDNTGSAIYAISGSEGMQIHQYDFSVPDENKRHVVVDKKGADESSLAYCDGEVYFVESDMESGPMIYRIKPDGGVRKSFRSGAAFAISPNYEYMAISVSTSDFSAGTGGGKFELYDMQNGTSTIITSEFDVYGFIWSWDGASIYYLENRLSGVGGEGMTSGDDTGDDAAGDNGDGAMQDGDDAMQDGDDAMQDGDGAAAAADPYPYTLWVYNVASAESRKVCDLPSTAITVTNAPNAVYMCYTDVETSGNTIRATYAINAQ